MIDVRDLYKNFGSVVALDGVSFQVPKGQVVGLLGPNGAGKTTAMRILTGFVAPSEGTALIDDIDVRDDPLACQRRIGYLPEGNPLYTDLRVTEALRFAADMHGIGKGTRRTAIAEAIEAVGLKGMEQRTIGTFSKGYKQRVGLAQALLHRPQVLILDEPTSGLDPNQQQDMRDLIRALGRERTVILSTHILPEVDAVCQRALIINRGRLVADGTVEEVRAQARRDQAVRVGVRAAPQAALQALRALPFVRGADVVHDSPGSDGERVLVRLVLSGDAAPALLEQVASCCATNRLPLWQLSVEETRFEDVFAALTAPQELDVPDAPVAATTTGGAQ